MQIPKSDYDELYRLIKLSNAEPKDIASINTLYKKYINSLAPDACGSCNGINSVSEYYFKLRDFYVTSTPIDETNKPKSE